MRDEFDQQAADAWASVLAEYLTRIDRGETVSHESFLAEHPEHTAALRDYFADVDLIERLSKAASNTPSAAGTGTPREFGDYELLGEIGRGGMGIVYRAQERSTGRCLALKMLLHGSFLSSAEVQRFRNESSTAAALRHPGIVPIYHVGEHQGRLFYTMPLIEGANLAEQIAKGPLDPKVAARLLLAVAEAVAAAHSHGVIHRDLKPANVLLDEHQIPYVADFGLARRLGEEQLSITVTGDLLGTPNYMAPEQVNGRHTLVGPLADIYALGAVLYAMLVGRPPFQSASVSDTLHKICTVEPVRPRQIKRDVPRDLETICLKCLEKSPTIRYPSAGELAGDLQRHLAGEPLHARPISRIEHGRRWFVRNPVVGTLAVGIALVLIAGTAFSLHYAQQAGQREQQALANLYAADMNLAQQHLRSGAAASAVRLLELHRPQFPLPGTPGRGEGMGADSTSETPAWEWRHLWHQCHAELRRFNGPQGAEYSAVFSPDGRTVAAAGADRSVWLWETATGKVLHKLSGHTAAVRDLAFAPDGQKLASVGDDAVGLFWDTVTGERLATLVATGGSPVDASEKPATGEATIATNAHQRPLTTVAFSADGRLIATGGNDEAKVNLWDATRFMLLQSLDLGPVESLAFAPNASRLAMAGRDGCVRLCQTDKHGTWTNTATIRAHNDVVHDVAWSPDGTRLATAGADRAVKLWDANSRRNLATFGPLKEAAHCVDFSPDGRRLAAAVRNEPLKVWEIEQPQNAIELLGHTALVTSAVFCPDGWRLLSASEDGSVRLWDAAQAADHDRLDGHLRHVRTVAFSPDGSVLASAGADDSTIILWNTKTGQSLRVFRSIAWTVSGLRYSPDGKYLAAAEDSGHLRIWNVETSRVTLDLALDPGPLVAVDWARQGDRIAVRSSGGTYWLVEASSGRLLATWSLPPGPHGSIAFNNDGSLLVTADGDPTIRVWKTATQSLVRELLGHTAPAVNAVFDPQGTLIASASNDHTIRLWDAATGRQLRTLTGHGGTPYGLAFTTDGKRLASCSTDQTVKIWDVATGLELQSLVGHTDWVRDIAFSPDDQHLASAGYDGFVQIWHAPNDEQTGTAPISPRAPSAGWSRGKIGRAPSARGWSLSHADWSTTREAAALVKHLAARTSTRESLVSAIEADKTINDAVRTAAIRQAREFLLYWEPMLAGHRAAQRGDWPAAIHAFDRVTTLAPDDVMHWHWLAMASLAAGRTESYQRACDELLRRFSANASYNDLDWTLRTWLVTPHDDKKLAQLGALVGANARDDPESPIRARLYELRTGKTPRDVLDSASPPASLGPEPLVWYVRAMVWLKLGNRAQAMSAYQAGTRRTRSRTYRWDSDVYEETLRREVEGLLAAEPATKSGPPARATATAASPSDVSRAGEPRDSVPSAAPK